MDKNNQEEAITSEILDHMMHPKNYGEIKEADGVGIGFDEQTNEFVAIYILVEDNSLKEIMFGTNGCTDTVVAGSLFTQMVKGLSISEANRAKELMENKIAAVPAAKRACSQMVLLAYEASIQHYEKQKNGENSELLKLKMPISCEGVQSE